MLDGTNLTGTIIALPNYDSPSPVPHPYYYGDRESRWGSGSNVSSSRSRLLASFLLDLHPSPFTVDVPPFYFLGLLPASKLPVLLWSTFINLTLYSSVTDTPIYHLLPLLTTSLVKPVPPQSYFHPYDSAHDLFPPHTNGYRPLHFCSGCTRRCGTPLILLY